ncbi:Trp biosynthesis-associated membrane protein [Streptosporangium sp. NPDC023615]|uniref:Trp biosynthesis-associated membrane protein n=1 Tax=Streptosporangium sp. NPDC023615 TaxID=3154794 RepID=UPI0034416899
MTAGREPWIWLGACVAGALPVLLAAGRDWFTVTYGTRQVALSAAELAPALGPAAWAALAAAVAVLATGGLWRAVVGAVLALCGAGVVAASWWGSGTDAALRLAAERAPTATATGAVPHLVPAPAWPLVAGAGGVLLLAAGVAAVLRGGRWPGMSGRYDRPGTAGPGAGRPAPGSSAPSGPSAVSPPSAASERALWDAIDEGTDPTAGPDPGTPDPAARPR